MSHSEILKLNDVCEFIVDCEHKTAPTQETGYPSIRTPNIGRGRLILENVNRVSEEIYIDWTKRAVPKAGDLILAREAPVGNVAIIPENIDVCLGQRTVLIRPDRTKVDNGYLLFLLLSDEMQGKILSRANGSTVHHLNMKDIRNLELPDLPLLATQQHIADILSTYDRLIDNNNRRIALLEESIHQLYKEWFVRSRFPGYESVKVVNGIPEGWKVSSIGNLSEVITRGITPKYDSESKNIVLNQKCIRNYQINFEFARQHHSQVSEHKKIRFGDVLINSTGIGTLGRVAQVLTNFEYLTVDTHITIVRPKVELEKHFFGVALENLQDYFDTLGEGATGQTELKRQLLNVVPLLLPDENIRKYFDEKASSARLLVQKLLEQNQRLKQARDLLLPRLMNGSIAV